MKILNPGLLIFCMVAIFASCEKSNNTNNNNNTTPTSANGSFTWTTNGTSTVSTADSAFYRAAFKTIFAYKTIGGIRKLQYEINLSAGTPATYFVGASNGITYTANTPYFVPNTGNIVITANSGTKISGTFQGAGTAASGTSSINGSFTDIPIQ